MAKKQEEKGQNQKPIKRLEPTPLDKRIDDDNESFVKHLDKMIIPKEEFE